MALHVDALIQQAMARGDFDDLPGRGKPLELDDDRGVPEEQRMAQRVLRNANVPPAEVSALSALGALREQLRETTDPVERERLMREFSRQDALVRMKLERSRSR